MSEFISANWIDGHGQVKHSHHLRCHADTVLCWHLQLDFTKSDYVAILHINNDNERPRNFSEALPGVVADSMLSLQSTDWVQCHGLMLACILWMSRSCLPHNALHSTRLIIKCVWRVVALQ